MQAFLISLAAKFFHIQPATATTKTFFTGLGWIAAAITAVCTLVLNNDQNTMHYMAAGAPLLQGLSVIFHRDALNKLANKITNITK